MARKRKAASRATDSSLQVEAEAEAEAKPPPKLSLDELFTPLRLPCGLVVPNRLVKAAMYEHLATLFGGPPNTRHTTLYSHWAAGGWGMILTGNFQVAPDHLSLGRDIVIPSEINSESCRPFVKLAQAIRTHASMAKTGEHQALAIMQLSHTGRQSPNILGGRMPFVSPLAPSAVPLELRYANTQGEGRWPSRSSALLERVLFQTPTEMSYEQIDVVVDAFVRGAKLAALCGFDGVELHASHGYLISQFISPKSNLRYDEYSGMTNPLHLLKLIVSSIRAPDIVPKTFAVGVKLSAGDYVDSTDPQEHDSLADDSASEKRALEHVRDIASWGMVDFIEISGGNYENPAFMDHSKEGPSARQALFARFSRRALAELSVEGSAIAHRPLVLLTGGLSTPEMMSSALSSGHADLLGIGRLSVTSPHLPRLLKAAQGSERSIAINEKQNRAHHELPSSFMERMIEKSLIWLWTSIPEDSRPQFPKLIGAGMEMASYTAAIHELSQWRVARNGRSLGDPGPRDIVRMWTYVAPGSWTPVLVLTVLVLGAAVLLSRV